jgi:hypothetical protein
MSDDLFAALEAEMGEIDTSDVVDLSTFSTADLLILWKGTEEELLRTGHAIWPRNQEERDLTSVRQAAMLLFKKRTGVSGYQSDFPDAP